MRQCPRDHAALELVGIGTPNAYHLCRTCSGLWLPGHVVSSFVGQIPPPASRASALTQRLLQCPDEGAFLHAVRHHGIEIDLCPVCCGVWLDRGELESILKRSRRSSTRGGAIESLANSDLLWSAMEAGPELAGAALEFIADALSGL